VSANWDGFTSRNVPALIEVLTQDFGLTFIDKSLDAD
jgi:hypothetical protein